MDPALGPGKPPVPSGGNNTPSPGSMGTSCNSATGARVLFITEALPLSVGFITVESGNALALCKAARCELLNWSAAIGAAGSFASAFSVPVSLAAWRTRLITPFMAVKSNGRLPITTGNPGCV